MMNSDLMITDTLTAEHTPETHAERFVGKWVHPFLFSVMATDWLFLRQGVGNVSHGLAPSAVSPIFGNVETWNLRVVQKISRIALYRILKFLRYELDEEIF